MLFEYVIVILNIHVSSYLRLKVFTPIGTKITIRLFHNEHGGRYGGTMNIDITMAPKDVNYIEGLCGQFDNNPANDFKDRDGIDLTINDFTESWR
jgi:hypothetical protein